MDERSDEEHNVGSAAAGGEDGAHVGGVVHRRYCH